MSLYLSVRRKEGNVIINKARELELARKIRDAGRPIYIAEENDLRPDNWHVRQIGGVADSAVFEYSAGTGVMIDLILTVNTAGIGISYFGLDLPWKPIAFQWLPDPREIDGGKIYRFADTHIDFAHDQVINHRADNRLLSRGESIKGLLLGTDMAPIPNEFRHGQLVAVTLRIGDQLGCENRSSIALTIRRMEKRKTPIPSRRGSLFSRRDRDPVPTV